MKYQKVPVGYFEDLVKQAHKYQALHEYVSELDEKKAIEQYVRNESECFRIDLSFTDIVNDTLVEYDHEYGCAETEAKVKVGRKHICNADHRKQRGRTAPNRATTKSDSICKYYKDEFCVNADCPCCADFCPVSQDNYMSICKYREDDKTKK